MEDISTRFRQCIGRVDFPRDMYHGDRSAGFPFLYSKIRNFDVSRAFSRYARVDNTYSGFVVFVDQRRMVLGVAQFDEN